MGTVKRFEDLEIWQLARELVNLIYDDFRNCKEFKQFLNISRGSCGEVKSMYYTAEDQKYVHPETANDRRNRASMLLTKFTNFIFYLKK